MLSNGIRTALEALLAKYQFHEWNASPRRRGIVPLDRIIVGVCEKNRFLDLLNFILFDN